jgi:hypothetical protein
MAKYFIAVDCSNAFNTLSRDAILEALQAQQPRLLPMYKLIYGGASRLFFGKQVINSETGVRQGDPLSPLLFSLTIHEILKEVSSLCGVLGFMDDIYLHGDDFTVLESAFFVVQERLEAIGLKVNLKKTVKFCNVSFPDAPLPVNRGDAVDQVVPVAFSENPEQYHAFLASSWVTCTRVLGAFIGTDEEVALCLDRKALSVIADINRLCILADSDVAFPLQDIVLLLRFCVAPCSKVGYLMNCMPPRLVKGSLGVLDDVLVSIMARLLDIPVGAMSREACVLMRLPIRQGGMGISSVADFCEIRYEESRRSLELSGDETKLDDPVDWYKDFLVNHAESLHMGRKNLKELYSGSKDVLNIANAFLRAVPKHAYLVLTDAAMRISIRALLGINPCVLLPGVPNLVNGVGSVSVDDELGVAVDTSIINNSLNPEPEVIHQGVIRIEVAPAVSDAMKINGIEERSCCSKWLKCPLCQGEVTPVHHLHCNSVNGTLISRHDEAKERLRKLLKKRQYICRAEPRRRDQDGFLEYKDGRRADLEIAKSDGAQHMTAADILITSGIIKRGEAQKSAKYNDCYGGPEHFHPVVISVLGRFGRRAIEFVNRYDLFQGLDKLAFSVMFHNATARVAERWYKLVFEARWDAQARRRLEVPSLVNRRRRHGVVA